MKSNVYNLLFAFLIFSSAFVTACTSDDDQTCTNPGIAKRFPAPDDAGLSTIFVTAQVTEYTSTATVFASQSGLSSESHAPSATNVDANHDGSVIYVTTQVTDYTSTTTMTTKADQSNTVLQNQGVTPSGSIIVSTTQVTDNTAATTTASQLASSSAKYNASSSNTNHISSALPTNSRSGGIAHLAITVTTNSVVAASVLPASMSMSSVLGAGTSNIMTPVKSSLHTEGSSTANAVYPTSLSHVIPYNQTIVTTNSHLLPATTSPFTAVPPSSVDGGTRSASSAAINSSFLGYPSKPTGISALSTTIVVSSSPLFSGYSYSSKPNNAESLTNTVFIESSVLEPSSQPTSPNSASTIAHTVARGPTPQSASTAAGGIIVAACSAPIPISKASQLAQSNLNSNTASLLTLSETDTLYSTRTVSTSGRVYIYYDLHTYSYTRTSTVGPTHASLTTATLSFGTQVETIVLTWGTPLLVDTTSFSGFTPSTKEPVENTVTGSASQMGTVDHTVTAAGSIRTVTASPSMTSSSSLHTVTSTFTTSSQSSGQVESSSTSSSGAEATGLGDSRSALLAFGVAALLV